MTALSFYALFPANCPRFSLLPTPVSGNASVLLISLFIHLFLMGPNVLPQSAARSCNCRFGCCAVYGSGRPIPGRSTGQTENRTRRCPPHHSPLLSSIRAVSSSMESSQISFSSLVAVPPDIDHTSRSWVRSRKLTVPSRLVSSSVIVSPSRQSS